ncbi:MAG: type I-C CRISPR-associated protein Cas8c/Csd1 [Clostridiaceae bacterium]|nr:type I-C CRISPR-associated protein Cas8c/Csd1 [Clostridiaceae bacterium]
MLKALYDYAVQNGLTLPPGFVNKKIRAYILLSASGDYLGIESGEDTLPCPDVGSLANGKDKCNVLAEKLSVVLSTPSAENPKSCFFRKTLEDAASAEPQLQLCLHALEDTALFSAICTDAQRRKLKGMDRISFRVDGSPIVSLSTVTAWWTEYRRQFQTGDETAKTRCLITGEPTVPLATVPTVSGLQTVGGHARGDALICFDKSAFCSYGLKQAANAPVSEEAYAAVKAALDDLLAGSPAMYRRDTKRNFNPTAPAFAGMKFVHWYDRQITPSEDILLPTIGGFGVDDEEEEEEEQNPEAAAQKARTSQAAAVHAATELVKSVQSGGSVLLPAAQYHILLLSGVNGRIMIRRYEHGCYNELQKHLEKWNEDLSMCDALGTGCLGAKKLTGRLLRLLKRQKMDTNPFERLQKELAGLTPSIVSAFTGGKPLPDAVAVRALVTIRAMMLDIDEDRKAPPIPDGICCQWLKVWLLRKHRMNKQEVPLMAFYNPNFPNAAYHCGAIVAIYAEIQRTAMGEVNAGIVQRFYASASRTPRLVLGQLERLSKFHLAKIESSSLARKYEDALNEAYGFFDAEIETQVPPALNLEEQSCFAIGYRQMSARLAKLRNEAFANKKVKEESQLSDKEEI